MGVAVQVGLGAWVRVGATGEIGNGASVLDGKGVLRDPVESDVEFEGSGEGETVSEHPDTIALISISQNENPCSFVNINFPPRCNADCILQR
jgi:hypothetical protein